MSPLEQIIAAEIAACGPVPFSRFMQLALYHEQHGYYRRARNPFGREGDFYTAQQLQPVFGRTMASVIRPLVAETGGIVVELGAARREMAAALAEFEYHPVDLDGGEMPQQFDGVVFSNEFFDALPVDVQVECGGCIAEQRVRFSGGRFLWDEPILTGAPWPWGQIRVKETSSHREVWLQRIAHRLRRGYVLTVDYGYLTQELPRFPEGTLTGYRSHRSVDDVLGCPGDRDITAHVDFSALQQAGIDCGLITVAFEKLATTLLRAGEADGFAAALSANTENEAARNRLQLKQLLFGMGETFRVLLQRK